jgi:hypothetical protein
MEDVFPYKEGIDYTRFQSTPEGLYSVTRRRDSERIVGFLRKAIPCMHRKILTDATACIGGDTLQFSQHFAHVHSIEWKRDNLAVLQNNIRAFGATNVTVHEGDATKVFNWKTDVLYVDPPWGGPKYHMCPKLEIFMSGHRLDKWLESILNAHTRPTYIVLKLPRNYNFAHLHFLPNAQEMALYRVRSFMVALIQTKVF